MHYNKTVSQSNCISLFLPTNFLCPISFKNFIIIIIIIDKFNFFREVACSLHEVTVNSSNSLKKYITKSRKRQVFKPFDICRERAESFGAP